MKGSLQIKNGKYYVVFNITKENGKKSTKWISTGYVAPSEKKKAEKYLKIKELEFDSEPISKADVDENLIIGSASGTVGQAVIPVMTATGQLVYAQSILTQQQSSTPFHSYIKDWLKQKKSNASIDPVTYEQYESICTIHLIPYFKKKKSILENLSYKDIQEYIDFEAKFGNTKTKSGLSPRTVSMLKKTLSQIFKTAKRDKLITDNPCEYVKSPKQIKPERTVLSLEQLQKFLNNIRNERIYPIIYITSVYGLRRSEVLGLQWDSIDYEKMTVTIKHTVVQGKELYQKDRTKNESSHRTYPMSTEIKNIFLSLKEDEEDNMKKFGKGYTTNNYVFKWDNGEIYKPDYLDKKLTELLEKYNLPHIRFHDLRHSCASYLASNGFQLKDIQEWLGHSDIETTANIYAHLYVDRKDQILTSLNQSVTESD